MEDQILHALVCDGEAALMLINSSATAARAKELLHLNDGTTAALARLMSAGALLAQRNKGESEKLTMIVNGGGPAGKLLVTASNDGTVKGCVDAPDAVCPTAELSLPALVGTAGKFTVVRDNPTGQPYVGVCNLVTGDITRDFAAYLVSSEQTPAAVALDAGERNGRLLSGGVLILPLPGYSTKTLDTLEQKISSVNDLLERLTFHESLEEMAYDLFWDVGVKPLETVSAGYRCDCSRERMAEALLSLGKTELLQLAFSQEETEIGCQFCNSKYRFSAAELKEMAKGITSCR